MSKAYDPSARANAMVVKYKVNATGDRWFIPYNDNGTKAAQTVDGFRSQAEVVAAMSDPRYERDPAYRQDLYDKLERSNVQF